MAFRAHPLYAIIFSHAFRTVYCPIPKAACTSWKEYFRRIAGLPEATTVRLVHDKRRNGLVYANSIDSADLLHILHSKANGYFKFTMGRTRTVA